MRSFDKKLLWHLSASAKLTKKWRLISRTNTRRSSAMMASPAIVGRNSVMLLFLSLLCATGSKADMVASPDVPFFTSEELAIISSNKSLEATVEHDPWLAQRVARALLSQGQSSRKLAWPDQDADSGQIDKVQHDPLISPRTTPEAAQDLFLLMKKVVSGGRSPPGQKPAPLSTDFDTKIGP